PGIFHRLKELQRADLFAATKRQRRFILEKKRDIGSKGSRDIIQLPDWQRVAKQFVDSKERRGCISTAPTQSGGDRNSLFQMNAHPFSNPCCRKEFIGRPPDEVARIHRERRITARELNP